MMFRCRKKNVLPRIFSMFLLFVCIYFWKLYIPAKHTLDNENVVEFWEKTLPKSVQFGMKPLNLSGNVTGINRKIYKAGVTTIYPLKDQAVPMTLVVAYMRGGSTFTADVLKQAADTFYLFEPLHDFSVRLEHGLPIRFMNGTEWNMTQTEVTEVKANIIKNWFLCNPEHVDHGALLDSHFRFHMNDLSSHYSCQRKVRGDRVGIIKNCLPFLRQKCLEAKARTIKLISVTFAVVKYLLKILPQVKIVHVIRDPRAIIDSQANSKLIDRQKVQEHAEMLCEVMRKNIKIMPMMEEYKENIIIIYYEEFAIDPIKTAKHIYEFTGLIFTSTVESFIRRIALTKGRSNSCLWCSAKGDSAMTSLKWRKRISDSDLKKVQNVCSDVMKVLGYKIIQSKSILDDFSVATYTKDVVKLLQ